VFVHVGYIRAWRGAFGVSSAGDQDHMLVAVVMRSNVRYLDKCSLVDARVQGIARW